MLLLACAVLIQLACAESPDAPLPSPAVFAPLSGLRPLELRIGFEGNGACTRGPGDHRVSPSLVCADAALSPDVLTRVARETRRLRADPSHPRGRTEARALALIDIALRPRDAEQVEGALARLLDVAARDSVDDPALLNELATVWAVRSGLRGASDLLRALDAIERSVRLDPLDGRAGFNRAVLLERLHLTGEAMSAWEALSAGDVGAPWTVEARERLEARDPSRPPDPQRLRELVIDSLLPLWGDALAGNRHGDAARLLDEARRAGRDVVALSGDSTAVLALREIERAEPGRVTRIARGLASYGAGRARFVAAQFDEARRHLEAARDRLDGTGPALAGWPELLLGAIAVYQSRHSAADSIYASVLLATPAAALPAMRARAHWGIGLGMVRRGRPAAAEIPYDSAAAEFTRMGERENLGALQMLLAEVHMLLGRHALAADLFARALRTLSEFPGSTQRHTLHLVLGGHLLQTGLVDAAAVVHAEGVRAARRTGRPKDEVEALARLAAAEAARGRLDIALERLREAGAALSAIDDPIMRDWMAAELAQGEAGIHETLEPDRAVDALSRAAEIFQRRRLLASLVPVLARRGATHLIRSDTASATADIAATLDLVRAEARRIHDPATRARLLESATPAFDGLIALQIDRGDIRGGLATLQDARWQPARAAGGPAFLSTPPSHVAVLEYAVLPDRVLLWIIRADTVALHTARIGTAELETRVSRFETLVRSQTTPAGDDPSGALHDLLLAAAEPWLEGVTELVLVPDKALHRVPFAALRDPRDGRYLIERFALRTDAGAASAFADRAPAVGRSSAAVVVGAPAHDRARHPDLAALGGAGREARTIAAVYDRAAVLEGSDATRDALLEALDDAEIFHFAGHARFRTDTPERSYLVLAAGHAPVTDDALFAADLEPGRWPRLRLVVLSACETLGAGASRNGGFGALAGAFRAAGAAGVLGTLWKVDDEATATLMVRFHTALASGLSPAAALRQAQLDMLADARTAHPAHWAAFRLEGS